VLLDGGELDAFTTAALKTQAEWFVLELSRLRFIYCCGSGALAPRARAVPAGPSGHGPIGGSGGAPELEWN
jgi:hypothetical protein